MHRDGVSKGKHKGGPEPLSRKKLVETPSRKKFPAWIDWIYQSKETPIFNGPNVISFPRTKLDCWDKYVGSTQE